MKYSKSRLIHHSISQQWVTDRTAWVTFLTISLHDFCSLGVDYIYKGIFVILEDFEMLKALFDFEATLAKTLSFNEGEFFFLQQINSKQRNWWHVVNRKGQVGFVPSNYVASVKVTQFYYLS